MKNLFNWVIDPQRKAFLLQMDHREKMVPQKNHGVVYCDSNCGPVFGWNSLVLGDNCNRNKNSSIEGIGGRYNREGHKNKYEWDSQETWRRVSGGRDDNMFRVAEYEVYSVHW